MKKTTTAALLLLLGFLLLAQGCMSSRSLPAYLPGQSSEADLRFSLERESAEYDTASGIWNVTFLMTITVTNTNRDLPADIGNVDVTIWPKFGKASTPFRTIYERIPVFQTLLPNQSVTKQERFSHTFTDDELETFAAKEYDIVVEVPGFDVLNKTTLVPGSMQEIPPFPAPRKSPTAATPADTLQATGTCSGQRGSLDPAGRLVSYDFENDFIAQGRVPDRSGNGHDAFLQGTATSVPGIAGQAIQFSGHGYLLADTNPAACRKDVTWAFWFNTDNPDNNYKMASAAWWRGGPGSGWTMATHIPEFWAEDEKGVCLPNITNTDNEFLHGKWNFEVVTYDGAIIREYTNGKLINTWQTRGVPLGEGSAMAVGGWPDVGFSYSGAIDEFTIYDHALTADEISRQYGALRPRDSR